ncbi:MAG: FapA family protein [Lachnospiraceae bacterium]|jgi:uncharacterized protein (DUF342 family)|nr:FapA family protein [Lachnospiraceae bacterium]
MNGYFQILHEEAGTYLKVIKPTDGGETVSVAEVMDYLDTHGVPFDVPTLNQGLAIALDNPASEMAVPLCGMAIPPINEAFKMEISPDKMQATARFYPPSIGGNRTNIDEITLGLMRNGATKGVKEDAINAFLANPQYCTDIVVAEGQEVKQGCNAKVEYFFETAPNTKPTLKEDGSVDFFHLHNIVHCQAGQVLARLTPEDRGAAGFTVTGEPLRPVDVRGHAFKKSNNVTISEDKLTVTANVDGHVSLVDGVIFVANVYQVENVNSATGNIDFEGSVVVKGNVYSNFIVKAKGNIEVEGVVEGAIMDSGGDIILRRGMKGMGRGMLKAKGNVISQFIENARVEAGGNVSTDAILHSEITAGNEISVTSKKGFITGGRVCAGHMVQVKTLGSQMGSDTIVEVGVDPTTKNRIQFLQKHINELNKEIKGNQPILNSMAQKIAQGVKLSPDQVKYVQNLSAENKERTAELEAAMDELDVLQEKHEGTAGASVVVTGDVDSGTMIVIGDISMTVQSSMSYCRFVSRGGEVKMTAI